MRSNLESALDLLVTGGWANESDGDVESPVGHFALIDMTTERAIMADILDEDGLSIDDVPPSWYVVVTDSLGFIYPLAFDAEREARIAYGERVRDYLGWSLT